MNQLTILDAARQWFHHVAGSPNFTREARQQARELERKAEIEILYLELTDVPKAA